MTSLFLYSFYVGFGLTLVSVLFGVFDVGGSHEVGDLAHGGDWSHGGDLAHGGDSAHGHHGHAVGKVATISPVNFQTVVASLMGFGGIGYLIQAQVSDLLLLTIPGAVAGGIVTAWLIFRFQRFLVRGERALGPTSYTGVVGKLTVAIREGGTGEMVYSQQDSRMVSAARSHDGQAIPRGEDVVILRYEKGVAYVQLWRDFMGQKTK